MYVYQLTYRDEGNILPVGYFGSWKKARNVMKKFRSTLPGFKEYPNYFVLKKVKLDEKETIRKKQKPRGKKDLLKKIQYYKGYVTQCAHYSKIYIDKTGLIYTFGHILEGVREI